MLDALVPDHSAEHNRMHPTRLILRMNVFPKSCLPLILTPIGATVWPFKQAPSPAEA